MGKKTVQSRLETFVSFFGKAVLSTDGQVLLCKVCEREISGDTKFLVRQHINGVKHKALSIKQTQYASSKVVQMKPFLKASGKQSQYNLLLCEALLSANIPLRKLDNKKFKDFLENQPRQPVPSSATLRLNYVQIVYEQKLEFIRSFVGEKSIWISMDETTDVVGRFVAHTIIGTLETFERRNFLLNAESLEKTNSSTIAQAFMNSLSILWPGGIHHERVLLFVTDGAAYMKKAGAALKVIFLKLIHATCVAHAVHRIAEEVRNSFPDVDKLVSSGKKIFRKSAARVTVFRETFPQVPLPPEPILTRWGTWLTAAVYYAEHFEAFSTVVKKLDPDDAASIETAQSLLLKDSLEMNLAFIKANFEHLPNCIKTLEEEGSLLVDSTKLFEETVNALRSVTGKVGRSIRRKCDSIVSRNEGYNELRKIALILSDASSPDGVTGLNTSEIALFKYAPITSADVERSFSNLKNVLSDRRQNFTFDNLKMHLVVQCNP